MEGGRDFSESAIGTIRSPAVYTNYKSLFLIVSFIYLLIYIYYFFRVLSKMGDKMPGFLHFLQTLSNWRLDSEDDFVHPPSTPIITVIPAVDEPIKIGINDEKKPESAKIRKGGRKMPDMVGNFFKLY